MKWGVVSFPGSLDDRDALYALGDVMEQDAIPLRHKDESLHLRPSPSHVRPAPPIEYHYQTRFASIFLVLRS